MKNILVCIKQVPDTTEIRIDPVKKTLIRDGVPSIVNPFDTYALELAARIKDKEPDTKITLICMGPPQAEAALKECLAVGGDKAYLVSGREFGGSDTLATSYILSCAVEKVRELEGDFDIIFCGKQAIDGDTAQVGPEMAEHLGLPQITYAVEATAEEERLVVKKETMDGFEMVAVKYPCLITVTKPSFDPRFPTIKAKLAANRAKINVLGAGDLDIDLTRAGLKGSPTKVKKTFTPEVKTTGVKIHEETDEASAEKLFAELSDNKII